MQVERIGENGVFLNEIGYAYLLDKTTFMKRLGMSLLIFGLAFFQTFITEQIAGMNTIWNTVPDGRGKIKRQKWIILIGSSLMLTVFVEGMFTIHGIREQQLTRISEQIRYLSEFESFGKMTISIYLLLRWIFEFWVVIGSGLVIANVSKKVKNTATVLLVSGGIVALCYLCMRFVLI